MLAITDMSVGYGRVLVVHGVSVSVEAGQIVSIVGPNGAGKSTTLLAIAGVLTPTKGSILFDNASIVGEAPEDIARMGLNLVPEGRHVFTQLSVEENIRLGA